MEEKLNNIFESADAVDAINEIQQEYEISSVEFLDFLKELARILKEKSPNIHPIQALDILRNAVEIYYGGERVEDKENFHTISEAVYQSYEKNVEGYENSNYLGR